jgi:hypothetical protein
MKKRIRPRKTERKYEMLGHTKAKEIALSDIREDLEFGSRYTGILMYSLEEQLKCFNNVSVCSIDDLADDIKIIPNPPRKEKRNGEIVSAYENQCLFDDKVSPTMYYFYLIEIKQAEGRISKELFSFIKDLGIKVHIIKRGVEFNPNFDFIEKANFCSSARDFMSLEDVSLEIKLKYDSKTLDEYQAILNIIDANRKRIKYGRYDFRPKADDLIDKMETLNRFFNYGK